MHHARSLTLALVLIAAPAAAAPNPVKLAMMGLQAGEGITDKLAGSVSEALVAELRRAGYGSVVTHTEVAAVLGHERQQQLLGCDDVTCYSELAGALGVQELLSGSIAKIGASWVIHLKRIDVHNVNVVAQSDRRLKDGTLDDLLDVLPAMTRELMAVGAAGGGAAPTGSAAKPSPTQEVPFTDPKELEGLSLFEKGKGRYLAINLDKHHRTPVFFGDGKRFYKQYTSGGSKSGKTKFSTTVWEPRLRDGWMRQVLHNDGVTAIQCGQKPTPVTAVAPAEAKRILASAQFFAPLWARSVNALASDDDGNYYVLDQAREPAGNQDFRLFVGPKGNLSYIPVQDVITKSPRQQIITAQGQLLFDERDHKPVVEWKTGTAVRTLEALSVFAYAERIYGELGVYDTRNLGTICDDAF